MQPGDLGATRFAVGKAAVFYSPNVWDWNSDLNAALVHLGFTEGEIALPFSETFNALTLPEYTGDAPHEAFVQGEAPVLTIPMYAADPALRAILSPTGGASGGHRRQRPVKTYTVVLVPEQLFVSGDPEAQTEESLVFAGASWTLGGEALTAAQEALLGQSVWLWRGYFVKPQYRFPHADGGKLVESVEFHVMYQAFAPNGHRLYTLGDPAEAGIAIDTGAVES